MESRPILKRGGTVACMVKKVVVEGPTEETGVSACAPSL